MTEPITDERLAEIEQHASSVRYRVDTMQCDLRYVGELLTGKWDQDFVAALLEMPARLTAEREAREKAEYRVEELEAQGAAVSAEFEGDCWKALRKLLTKFNYNWQDADADGVTADDAHEFLTEALEYDESRAEAAEAKLTAAEAEAARLREALTPFLPAYLAYVETMQNFIIDGETSAERRFSKFEREDEANERASQALASVTFANLAAVNAALAPSSPNTEQEG